MADKKKMQEALDGVAANLGDIGEALFDRLPEDLEAKLAKGDTDPLSAACHRTFHIQGAVIELVVADSGDVIPVNLDEDGNPIDLDGNPLKADWPHVMSIGDVTRKKIPSGGAILHQLRPSSVLLAPKPGTTRTLTSERFPIVPQLNLEVYYVDENGREVQVMDEEVLSEDILEPTDLFSSWGKGLIMTPLLTFDGEAPAQRMLKVTVTLVVESLEPRSVELPPVPLPMVEIPLPTLLLLATEENFEPFEPSGGPFDEVDGAFWFVVPPGGPKSGVGKTAVEALKLAAQVLGQLGRLVPPAATTLLSLVDPVLTAVAAADSCKNLDVREGDCMDLNEWELADFSGSNANDEVDSVLLLASPGREVRLYCDTDQSKDQGCLTLMASPVGITLVPSLSGAAPESVPSGMLDVTESDDDSDFHDSLSSLLWRAYP
jgi:hypothetical protein